MLYLVKPHGEMQWCDMPAQMTLRLAAEHDIDLARLEWRAAERRADDVTVSLALRYGVKATGGIVLDGVEVYLRHRPREMAEIFAASDRTRATLPNNDELMEQLAPGWTQHGRELDARVEETKRRALREAEEDLDDMLVRKAVDPDLLAHWTALGGRTPRR